VASLCRDVSLSAEPTVVPSKQQELPRQPTDVSNVLLQELLGKIEGFGKNIQDLQSKINRLESSNTRLESSNTDLQSKVDRLESSNTRLESSNTRLESSNTDLQSKVDRLESELAKCNDELEKKNQNLTTTIAHQGAQIKDDIESIKRVHFSNLVRTLY
jgi:chromosome segregation ATPase